MKRIAVATFLLVALGMVIPTRQAQAQLGVSVSIGTFYDELSPHGEWIDCSYGECWVPRGVGEGWQPYTNGEWIYTRYGWTWVSNDPWGGDPYHYGTWAFIRRYGWVWIPGTIWAPAWVTWRYSDRYVGWAPMPPTVTFGRAGYSGRAVVLGQEQYVFVPTNRFVGTNVTSVRVEPRQNAEIFRQGRSMTRFGVSGGVVTNVALPVATVQRAMGTKIETRDIGTARTTPRTVSSGVVGKSGRVAIVAPADQVKAARSSRQQAAPKAAQREPQPQQVKQQQARQQEQAGQQQKAQKQQQARQQEQAGQQQKAQKQQQARQQEQAGQQQKAQKQQQARQQEQAQRPQQQQPQQRQPQAQPPQQQRPEANPSGHPNQGQPQQGGEKAKQGGPEKGKDQDAGKKGQPGGKEQLR